MQSDSDYIKSRIEKDISLFNNNIKTVKGKIVDKTVLKVVELSEMYANDSKSYLDKGDLYTSFSCISYAHGLLDAIKEMIGSD